MSNLKVLPIQTNIIGNDPEANLLKIESIILSLDCEVDVVALPEAFSTGFDVDANLIELESFHGESINRLKELSKLKDVAICGSILIREGESLFNRGFFITPHSVHYADKRHLFRLGNESKLFKMGEERLIVNFKGWRICLMVCYDLRFPVWSRNKNNDEYDLLIYVSNWPEARKDIWEKLLFARAIENQAYLIGVNRVGMDEKQTSHSGGTVVIDYKGDTLLSYPENAEDASVVLLSKDALIKHRDRYPFGLDADNFTII